MFSLILFAATGSFELPIAFRTGVFTSFFYILFEMKNVETKAASKKIKKTKNEIIKQLKKLIMMTGI